MPEELSALQQRPESGPESVETEVLTALQQAPYLNEN